MQRGRLTRGHAPGLPDHEHLHRCTERLIRREAPRVSILSRTPGAKYLHRWCQRRRTLTPTPLPVRGRGARVPGCVRQNWRRDARFRPTLPPSSPLSRAPGEGLGGEGSRWTCERLDHFAPSVRDLVPGRGRRGLATGSRHDEDAARITRADCFADRWRFGRWWRHRAGVAHAPLDRATCRMRRPAFDKGARDGRGPQQGATRCSVS